MAWLLDGGGSPTGRSGSIFTIQGPQSGTGFRPLPGAEREADGRVGVRSARSGRTVVSPLAVSPTSDACQSACQRPVRNG